MISEIDAGPVYLKLSLSLNGKAQDIYNEMAILTWKMISYIIKNNPKPKEQRGKVFSFKRKTPEESKILSKMSLEKIYDQIRMLDAETYPRAFINENELNLEFFDAELKKDRILAKVEITKKNK